MYKALMCSGAVPRMVVVVLGGCSRSTSHLHISHYLSISHAYSSDAIQCHHRQDSSLLLPSFIWQFKFCSNLIKILITKMVRAHYLLCQMETHRWWWFHKRKKILMKCLEIVYFSEQHHSKCMNSSLSSSVLSCVSRAHVCLFGQIFHSFTFTNTHTLSHFVSRPHTCLFGQFSLLWCAMWLQSHCDFLECVQHSASSVFFVNRVFCTCQSAFGNGL